jgi:hypothetical protein
MNERIKELHDKAFHETKDYYATIQKFAELIVQECIDQILTGPNGPAYYAVEAAMRVKKHFGVEE